MAHPDQGEVAWSHVLSQHRDDAGSEAFFKSFYAPMTGAANALDDLTLALILDNAEGNRLDLIGSIVGSTRGVAEGIQLPFFGFRGYPSTLPFKVGRLRRSGEPTATTYVLADAEYRITIRAKIALNNARGTGPEMEAAARAAYRAPRATAIDTGNASVELRIGRPVPETDPLFRTLPKLMGRAAGVRLNVTFEDAIVPFGFRGYNGTYGFGVGTLSRKGGSQ